jgi:hypothetical protein
MFFNKSLIVEPEAKQYFFAEQKDSNFHELVRISQIKGEVEVVTYEHSRFPKLYSLFARCRGEVTTGEEAAESLRGDLQAQKLAQGDRKALVRQRWQNAAEKVSVVAKGSRELERSGLKGCIVDEEYWPEVLSPMHFGTNYRAALKKLWRMDKQTSESFLEWSRHPANRKAALEGFLGYPEFASDKTFIHPQSKIERNEVDEGKLLVKYLTAEEREAYSISVNDGRLFLHDNSPLNTAHFQSMKKSGRAIFVMAPSGHLYAGSHVVNRFHHSSFLSGAAVLGAGELITDDMGKLIGISNKSGHYKPAAENILNVLKKLDEAAVDLNQVEVKILRGEGMASFVYPDAKEFIKANGEIPPQMIVCPNEESRGDFARELKGFQAKGMDLSKINVALPQDLGKPVKIMNALEFLKDQE